MDCTDFIFLYFYILLYFSQDGNPCPNPKYLSRHHIRVNITGCRTYLTTRQSCLNHCFENDCLAAVFKIRKQKSFCCTYYNNSDIYYSHGNLTLYYRSDITICAANQQPPNCTCIRGRTGSQCNSCVMPNYQGPDCTSCKHKYDITTGCTSCLDGYDITTHCTTCMGNYDINSDCMNCTGNFDPASYCQTCLAHWVGDQCNSCDFGLAGPDCNQCATNVEWTGEYTTNVPDGKKQLTFIFHFSGSDCTQFTGL